MVAIGLQEATQLMMSLPLAFARQGEQFLLVVLLGLQGENLMVGADGKWLGTRVPGALQHYPFRLLRDAEGRDLLGVDESGLPPAGAIGGAPLFDSDGKPAPELAGILTQLKQGDQDRQRARQAAALLDQHALLGSWELKIKDESGALQKLDGLYRLNEEKLNALPADALHTLRDAGALLMAYCQLLSMQNVQSLGQLSAARQRQAQQTATGTVAGNLISDSGVISFANL
jgi:hypothetical protein